jgi:hypothetical protein
MLAMILLLDVCGSERGIIGRCDGPRRRGAPCAVGIAILRMVRLIWRDREIRMKVLARAAMGRVLLGAVTVTERTGRRS